MARIHEDPDFTASVAEPLSATSPHSEALRYPRLSITGHAVRNKSACRWPQSPIAASGTRLIRGGGAKLVVPSVHPGASQAKWDGIGTSTLTPWLRVTRSTLLGRWVVFSVGGHGPSALRLSSPGVSWRHHLHLLHYGLDRTGLLVWRVLVLNQQALDR